jgi:hypothetical protein
LNAIIGGPILNEEMSIEKPTSTNLPGASRHRLLGGGVRVHGGDGVHHHPTCVSLLVFCGLLALGIFAAAAALLGGAGRGLRAFAQP